MGVGDVDHELGYGAGGVKFASVASTLEVAQDVFVDVVEEVAILHVVEINLADAIDDLAHEGAGLHVVEGIGEDLADDIAAGVVAGAYSEVFETWEEIVVCKGKQFIAGDAFVVGCPVAPAQAFGDGRAIAGIDLVFFFLGVVNAKEDHPDHLGDTLGIAINACILAHNVLHGFDERGDGHWVRLSRVTEKVPTRGSPTVLVASSDLRCEVDGFFQGADGGDVLGFATEGAQELDGKAELVEGREVEQVGELVFVLGGFNGGDAFVGVFIEQGG